MSTQNIENSSLFLGYLCLTGLFVTLIIPIPWSIFSGHDFWYVWEITGVVTTAVISTAFWWYELYEELELGKVKERISSVLVFLGALSLILGEWIGHELESPILKLLLLLTGTIFITINTRLMWKACEQQPSQTEKMIKYRSCFQFSDFPTSLTFFFLLLFIFAVTFFSPQEQETEMRHHFHEIRAFVSGSVAFQLASSNIAYSLTFFPTPSRRAAGDAVNILSRISNFFFGNKPLNTLHLTDNDIVQLGEFERIEVIESCEPTMVPNQEE